MDTFLASSNGLVVAAAPPRRRRHFRYNCVKEATLKVGRSTIKSRVRNASAAGATLEVEKSHFLEPGTNLVVNWSGLADLMGGSLEKTCVIPGTVVRVGPSVNGSHIYGVKFDRLIREQMSLRGSRLRKTVVACATAAITALICYMKIQNITYFWYDPWIEGYSICAAAFVLARVGLSFFYKEPPDRNYFPTVSIVIAAKNEEAHIAETVEHCFRSHYPPDLFNVFAIDDGSTDRTWAIMQSLAKKYPRFKAFKFDTNKGKRHGMALGAEKADGDILVYVDSDSYIDPDSLYRIVQPFAEPKVGAVSGHVLAAIEEDNYISKMEAVRYYISHRIMKAAESLFGVVTCCPGAFSAYRRSAVLEIVPAWLKQTFFGASATFGDDRSLTNHILKKYSVVYHAGALAVTYVPRTLYQFFCQQLRWKKSWSRETTIAVRIMYKKHPVAAFFYYVGVVLTLISPLVALRAIVFVPLFHSSTFIPYVLGVFLVSLFFCLICLYYTESKYWYYGILFSLLYLCVLSFQNYYAISTMRKNHWGTR